MRFKTEKDLEKYLRHLIKVNIASRHSDIYLLESKKTVDIVICRDGDRPALFFLELKLCRPNIRIPIGTGNGTGYQPEIVTLNPTYLESNLRWVLVNSEELKTPYLFVPTSTVKRHLAGGGIGEKYNNIQREIFRLEPTLTEAALVDSMVDWLLKPNVPSI